MAVDDDIHYVLLDEIQKVDKFETVLNSMLHKRNLDIYVTGSNSKFLSKDIITELRGRSDEIRVFPYAFSEFINAYDNKYQAWKDYLVSLVLKQNGDEQKSKYLSNLFESTYKKDIIERNKITKDNVLDSLVNILASSVGSLTSSQKLYNTYISKGIKGLLKNTIYSYIDYLTDSFLIQRVERYDVKGKKYISTPQKYYFSDFGIRNAKLNFRQQEENHIMENIIYNELIKRGYNVDVGVVVVTEGNSKKQLEVDFVCNMSSKRYYIQSAINIDDSEKAKKEFQPLNHIGDSFKKIVVIKDDIKPWYNEDGILIIGIIDFLLNPNSLDL